jgi:hypothetical protein
MGARQINGPQYAFKVAFEAGGVIHETCELDLERVLDSLQTPG